MKSNNTLPVFLVILGVFAIGCGDTPEMPIHGKVSFDGKPIQKGTIIFIPKEKTIPQSVAEIKDGEYVSQGTEGVQPGDYQLRITGYRGTGKRVAASPLSGDGETEIVEQFVPAKYNSQSTLDVTIEAGKLEYDFVLSSDN